MKNKFLLFIPLFILLSSCTSQKKLAYLKDLPEPDGQEYFTMEVPGYRIQPRDILFITAKGLTAEGRIEDYLSSRSGNLSNQIGGGPEASGYLFGYDVSAEGYIRLPVIDTIKVEGLTLEQARETVQRRVDSVFRNTTVECKLLSFKFTVIGEVRAPGTYVNYNNYLTVFEAVGRAGGIGDFGKRDRVLVVRPSDKGSMTHRVNLQDKSVLKSEAYFLLPNDVVIVEPQTHKIFNLNLPTIAFLISTVTSTITTALLLIDYFK